MNKTVSGVTQATAEEKDATLLALVNNAREGNRPAFEALVGRYQQRIFRMIYYRTRSRMDAEDLTQDVFIRAFRNLRRLKEPERFQSWLYSIAVNRVRDFGRKQKFKALFGALPEKEDVDPSDADIVRPADPQQEMIRKDFWQHLSRGLEQLPKMEREVFTLRFLDQLGIKEISETLEKSESTVKTHLYRAMKKFQQNMALRQFLEEEPS